MAKHRATHHRKKAVHKHKAVHHTKKKTATRHRVAHVKTVRATRVHRNRRLKKQAELYRLFGG